MQGTKGESGHKLDTAWLGPAKILFKMSNSRYKVQLRPGHTQEVHQDQIKPQVAGSITGQSYDLSNHRGGIVPLGIEPHEWNVKDILEHRRNRAGQQEFLNHWQGYDLREASWVPTTNYIQRYSWPWVKYCQQKGLYPEITKSSGQYLRRRSNDPRPCAWARGARITT